MKITNAKYTDIESDGVVLTFEDETTFTIPTQKHDYEYTKLFNEFIENGGIIENFKTAAELLKDSQNKKIEAFKSKYLEAANKDFKYKNECYKAGEKSAAAIASSITLAKALGETNCFIVAKNDTKTKYSFDDVLELSALIAKQWRTNWFKYKALKVRINSAENESDLDLIEWN